MTSKKFTLTEALRWECALVRAMRFGKARKVFMNEWLRSLWENEWRYRRS